MLLIRRFLFQTRVNSVQQNALLWRWKQDLASTVSLWLRSITVKAVLWKVLCFVSCQKFLVTIVNVVQGERQLVTHLTKYIVLV
jgi:hypothetical protein